VVDLERDPDNLGNEGVIKSNTCWNVSVSRKFSDMKLLKALLERYYYPYHKKTESRRL